MASPSTGNDSILHLFRGASVVFLGLMLERGLAFVVKLLLARFFGQTGYGAISIGITVMATVSTMSLLGLHTGIGRYLPRYDDPKRRRGVLVSAFSIVLPVALVAGGLCFVFADLIAGRLFNDASLTPIIRAFSFIVPLNSLVIMTLGVIQGKGESVPKVYIQNIGLPISKFAVVGIGLSVGATVASISWGYIAAYGAISFACVYYLYQRTSLFEKKNLIPMHSELTSFSLPLLVSTTMGLVLNSMDVFVLGYIGTTGDVGVYRAVYPLAKLLIVSLGAFGFVLLPVLSQSHSENDFDTIGLIYRLSCKWILIISLPILFLYLYLPIDIITASFGSEYTEGWIALSVLSIGFLCHAVAGPNIDTLTSLGKTRLVMADNIIAAVINICLNIVLIPRYNYLGAAVATTVSFVLLNTLSTVQLYRAIGAHPISEAAVRLIITAGVLGFICSEVVTSVTASAWLSIFGFGLLFGPVYLIDIIVVGGISESELVLLDKFQERTGIDLSFVQSTVQWAEDLGI